MAEMKVRLTFSILAAGLAAAAAAPAAVPARAAYPPIRFTIPARFNIVIGKPFRYDLCRPRPAKDGRCGGAGTTNPSGGFGHFYVFSVRFGTHLPPGLTLSSRSGALQGVPKGPPGITRFNICVRDAENRPGNQMACARTDGSVVNAAPPVDRVAPPVPTALKATPGARKVVLAWTASAAPDLLGYKVYRDGTLIGTTRTNSYTDTGVGDAETHSYAVSAYDGSGNESARSAPVSATTAPPDFSGTYRGTWGGTFNGADGCTVPEGGTLTVVIAKTGDTTYSVSETLGGYRYKTSPPPECAKSDLADETFSFTATVSDGKLASKHFTVTGSALSGGWTSSLAGSGETVTLSASR